MKHRSPPEMWNWSRFLCQTTPAPLQTWANSGGSLPHWGWTTFLYQTPSAGEEPVPAPTVPFSGEITPKNTHTCMFYLTSCLLLGSLLLFYIFLWFGTLSQERNDGLYTPMSNGVLVHSHNLIIFIYPKFAYFCRSNALPPLDWPLPSQFDQYELRIDVQPRPHHRAHYETEGSRGAVKASPGGHPVVKVKAWVIITHTYLCSNSITQSITQGFTTSLTSSIAQ